MKQLQTESNGNTPLPPPPTPTTSQFLCVCGDLLERGTKLGIVRRGGNVLAQLNRVETAANAFKTEATKAEKRAIAFKPIILRPSIHVSPTS